MIKVKRLVESAQIPVKAHETDAGYDLFSITEGVIPAGGRLTIQTGIAIELPNLGIRTRDLYMRIAPRSGMAVLSGINVLAGVIDRGYTGELLVCLHNTSDTEFTVNIGDRIAQMIPTYTYKDDIAEVPNLTITDRDSEGIGSTGI